MLVVKVGCVVMTRSTFLHFFNDENILRILEGSQVITLKDISFRFYHTKINRKKMLVVKVGCVVMTRSTFLHFLNDENILFLLCVILERDCRKRLSSVTSLFTILEWMPLVTPNVSLASHATNIQCLAFSCQNL